MRPDSTGYNGDPNEAETRCALHVLCQEPALAGGIGTGHRRHWAGESLLRCWLVWIILGMVIPSKGLCPLNGQLTLAHRPVNVATK